MTILITVSAKHYIPVFFSDTKHVVEGVGIKEHNMQQMAFKKNFEIIYKLSLANKTRGKHWLWKL